MKIIKRSLENVLMSRAKGYSVVGIFGPRQSGKTTLAKLAFAKHKYVSLEDIEVREAAKADARSFLQEHENKYGIILDEVQKVPELLSYIQTIVDEKDRPGYFVLTGSQNFLLNQHVSQTLAGRIAITTLLPFSINELEKGKKLPKNTNDIVYKGFYPPVYSKKVIPEEWYADYLQTYVERDVRQIQNVTNLLDFQRFIKLCAGRIGQVLNVSSLATDCGISVSTANSWISILAASYIIFLLQPHYKNFSRRLIKSPKLYFYDSGLACFLLGLKASEQLINFYLRGGLFENMVISDLIKQQFNSGTFPSFYFWRDNHGHEIDYILEDVEKLIPIEIKAGKTINSSYFDALKYFKDIAKKDIEKGFVVYAGNSTQTRGDFKVLNLTSTSKIFK